MKEVVRVTDARLAALLGRQATQYAGADQIGLDRIVDLLDRLGRPQDRLPPVFHVAGTNGKGSTCAFLRAALEAAGKRVHAFTSPHLVRYNERIRLAGRLIDDAQLADVMDRVLDANEGIGASLFEVNTAAAMIAFAEVPADACILEVGLGGRLDATNVVDRPLVTGIASLGLDHQQFLGDRLTDIAGEKAGIAKRGVPLVTLNYGKAEAARIGLVAGDAGAIWEPWGLHWSAGVSDDRLAYRDRRGTLDLPRPVLAGSHQATNAALAIAMLRHQSAIDIPDVAFAEAMQRAQWPARLQKLESGPLVERLPAGSELWIDGGHNPSAARFIAGHAGQYWAGGDLPLVILFASLLSKDSKETLAPFRNIASRVLTLPIEGHECRSPRELAELAAGLGFETSDHDGLLDALAAIRDPSRVLVFGSLYLAGEALGLNGTLPD